MTAPSRWRTWLALGVLVLLVVWMATDWSRFSADFIPLDASRVGPNLVASVVQAGLILVALSLIYPPTRHWIERYLEEHADRLKAHVVEDNERVKAELRDKLDVVHACLDHLVTYLPDVPNLHESPLGPTPPGSVPAMTVDQPETTEEAPEAPVAPAEPEEAPAEGAGDVEEPEGA